MESGRTAEPTPMATRSCPSPALVARSFLVALLASLPLDGCISSAPWAPDVAPLDPTSEELERFRKETYVDTRPEFGTAVENFLFARARRFGLRMQGRARTDDRAALSAISTCGASIA